MQQPASKKILLIRFSSIGDVTQALSVPSRLRELNAEIHWITRADLALLLTHHPAVDRIWRLERGEGISGLFRLISQLRRENFTHVYDAHNNLRSHLITWGLCLRLSPPQVLRRSMQRWKRFLLLRFHRNLFRTPFSGQRDFLEPLKAWGLGEELPPVPQIFCDADFAAPAREVLREKKWAAPIGLVPSAAYPLKRWPLEFFKDLVRALPDEKFLLFGGPEDHFLNEIAAVAPDRVLNLAGHVNLAQTSSYVALCKAVVANDTGVLHIAEQLGRPAVALMGPAPFGFPSRPTTRILQRDLYCRPCSKHGQGPCVNPEFQKCLRDISVTEVAAALQRVMQDHRPEVHR